MPHILKMMYILVVLLSSCKPDFEPYSLSYAWCMYIAAVLHQLSFYSVWSKNPLFLAINLPRCSLTDIVKTDHTLSILKLYTSRLNSGGASFSCQLHRRDISYLDYFKYTAIFGIADLLKVQILRPNCILADVTVSQQSVSINRTACNSNKMQLYLDPHLG